MARHVSDLLRASGRGLERLNFLLALLGRRLWPGRGAGGRLPRTRVRYLRTQQAARRREIRTGG